MQFAGAVRHRGPRDRHGVVRRERPGQGPVRGSAEPDESPPRCPGRPRPPPKRSRPRWHDTKLAQVLYHDWEAADLRRQVVDLVRRALHRLRPRPVRRRRRATTAGRTSGARARLRHRLLPAQPDAGRGAQTGSVTDLSPGMVEAALRNAEHLGFEVDGRVADAETHPVRRRHLRPRRRARRAAPHPGRRAGAARDAARAQAGRPVRVRGRAHHGRRLLRPRGSAGLTWKVDHDGHQAAVPARLAPSAGGARRVLPRRRARGRRRPAHLRPGRPGADWRCAAGAVEVRTATEEFAAALRRAGRCAPSRPPSAGEARAGAGRMFAYGAWQRLSLVDRRAARRSCRASSSTTS